MSNRAVWSGRRLLRTCFPADLRRLRIVQRALSTRRVVPVSRVNQLRQAASSVVADPAVGGAIWAISMVRDEQDTIAETVMHFLEQGIDHIIVADSLDR